MKCPECQKEGERSTVHGGGCATTCMGYAVFWDEDGAYHSHDPNRTSASYRCSRGHEWTTSHYSQCPSCNWADEHAAEVDARRERLILCMAKL